MQLALKSQESYYKKPRARKYASFLTLLHPTWWLVFTHLLILLEFEELLVYLALCLVKDIEKNEISYLLSLPELLHCLDFQLLTKLLWSTWPFMCLTGLTNDAFRGKQEFLLLNEMEVSLRSTFPSYHIP